MRDKPLTELGSLSRKKDPYDPFCPNPPQNPYSGKKYPMGHRGLMKSDGKYGSFKDSLYAEQGQ